MRSSELAACSHGAMMQLAVPHVEIQMVDECPYHRL